MKIKFILGLSIILSIAYIIESDRVLVVFDNQ